LPAVLGDTAIIGREVSALLILIFFTLTTGDDGISALTVVFYLDSFLSTNTSNKFLAFLSDFLRLSKLSSSCFSCDVCFVSSISSLFYSTEVYLLFLLFFLFFRRLIVAEASSCPALLDTVSSVTFSFSDTLIGSAESLFFSIL
jgi:hypothetical protein